MDRTGDSEVYIDFVDPVPSGGVWAFVTASSGSLLRKQLKQSRRSAFAEQ